MVLNNIWDMDLLAHLAQRGSSLEPGTPGFPHQSAVLSQAFSIIDFRHIPQIFLTFMILSPAFFLLAGKIFMGDSSRGNLLFYGDNFCPDLYGEEFFVVNCNFAR